MLINIYFFIFTYCIFYLTYFHYIFLAKKDNQFKI